MGQEALGGVVTLGLVQSVKDGNCLGLRVSNSDENSLEPLRLYLVQGQILGAEISAVLNLDPEVLHQVDLKVDDVVGQPVGGELRGVEAPDVVLLLEDGDVVVAEPRQERGGGDGGGAAAKQGHLDLETLGERRRDIRRQHLSYLHLLEHLHGKVLEASDIDRTLLGRVEVAAADAEVGGRADHAAGEAQGVVTEDGLGGSVVILV